MTMKYVDLLNRLFNHQRFRMSLWITVCLVLCAGFVPPLEANQMDPSRVADPDFKNDTPLQQTYERHNLENVLQPPDSFPQDYEREIVLKLPQLVATDTEYNDASDTEKALYLWFKPNGKLHESNRYFTFLLFGIDEHENIYVMAKNGKSIRKYNPRGEYIETIRRDDSRYKNWSDTVARIYYRGNSKFQGPYDSLRLALPTVNEDMQSPLPITEIDMFTRFAKHNGDLLDVRDEKGNFYTHLTQYNGGLNAALASPFAKIESWYHIERTFIGKFSSSGEMRAGFEVLPSYILTGQWRHAPWGGQTQIKIIDSETFYVTGATFYLNELNAYIFKYSLKQ